MQSSGFNSEKNPYRIVDYKRPRYEKHELDNLIEKTKDLFLNITWKFNLQKQIQVPTTTYGDRLVTWDRHIYRMWRG